jgi:hypothetical protein
MGAVGVEARGGGRSPRSGHSLLHPGAETGLDQTIMTTTGPGWVAVWRASDGRALDAVPCGPAGRRVVAWSITMPSGFQQPASSSHHRRSRGTRRPAPVSDRGGASGRWCTQARVQAAWRKVRRRGVALPRLRLGGGLAQGLARRRGAGAAPLDAPTLQDAGRCHPCRGWGRPPPAAVDGPRYRVAAAGPRPGAGGGPAVRCGAGAGGDDPARLFRLPVGLAPWLVG